MPRSLSEEIEGLETEQDLSDHTHCLPVACLKTGIQPRAASPNGNVMRARICDLNFSSSRISEHKKLELLQ